MSIAATNETRARAEERGWRPWLKWYLVLPVIVLLGSVGIQAFNPFRESPEPKPKHLAGALPVAVAGWRVQDVPLGPTEFVAEQVQEILRTDDVVFREYRRPGVQVAVYVAYWGGGKMPTRLVASHTPDRCWTENGWRCLDMRFKEKLSVAGAPLLPAEWRRFADPHGGITYVLFWHLIEGRAYDYGERFNAIPNPVEWWKDAVQQAMFGSREQYFVRVTSNVPFTDIWDDPGLQTVFAALERLGLAADNAAAME